MCHYQIGAVANSTGPHSKVAGESDSMSEKFDMKLKKRRNNHLTLTVQIKNWLPLVSGPALAMLNTPAPTCFTTIKFF